MHFLILTVVLFLDTRHHYHTTYQLLSLGQYLHSMVGQQNRNNDEVMFKVQLTEARLLEIKLISAILLRLIHRTHRLTHLEIMIAM